MQFLFMLSYVKECVATSILIKVFPPLSDIELLQRFKDDKLRRFLINS